MKWRQEALDGDYPTKEAPDDTDEVDLSHPVDDFEGEDWMTIEEYETNCRGLRGRGLVKTVRRGGKNYHRLTEEALQSLQVGLEKMGRRNPGYDQDTLLLSAAVRAIAKPAGTIHETVLEGLAGTLFALGRQHRNSLPSHIEEDVEVWMAFYNSDGRVWIQAQVWTSPGNEGKECRPLTGLS